MVDEHLRMLHSRRDMYKAGKFEKEAKGIDKEIKQYEVDKKKSQEKSRSDTHAKYEKIIAESEAKKSAKKAEKDAIKKKNQEINRKAKEKKA